jgi:hypothetical protein
VVGTSQVESSLNVGSRGSVFQQATALSCITSSAASAREALHALSTEDWAWSMGYRYCAIMLDLEHVRTEVPVTVADQIRDEPGVGDSDFGPSAASYC